MQPKILLIRRDNIGDLVCVTPLLQALRERFPQARICALVNSYNRAVVENHPAIDQVFSYTKAKHRRSGQSLAGVYFDRLRLMLALRSEHFDYAILAAPGHQQRALGLARLIRPRHIVGFVETPKQRAAVDLNLPYPPSAPLHEVEDVFRLAGLLGIDGTPPPPAISPDPLELAKAQAGLAAFDLKDTLTVGIHISARKPGQRWPAEHFVALARDLQLKRRGIRYLLFWSPGDDANPLHPGDDAKAREIMHGMADLPVVAYPTAALGELIGGLAACDVVICSDGGAMHLAAGLGKPLLCFFGQSDARRWHPWGVPYELLQPESRNVQDITVADAVAGFGRLMQNGSREPTPLS